MRDGIKHTSSMEPMDIFYQILHEDLNPLTSQTTQKFNSPNSKNQKPNHELTKEENNSKEKERYSFYENLLSDTLKKVKRDIHNKVFRCIDDPSSINSIIQNHQILLLNYCKVIEQTYLPDDKNEKYQISEDKSITDIFKLVYQTLDTILDYLEAFFYKYLEHSLEMPYQRKLWFAYNQKSRCTELSLLIEKSNISTELKHLISAPLKSISKNELVKLTYSQKSYYLLYIKVLRKLFLKGNPNISEIYALMISLDFNTFHIFSYISKRAKKRVNGVSSIHKKLVILFGYLKELKAIAITSNQRFNPELPSLKEQLLVKTTEEILFYQKVIDRKPQVKVQNDNNEIYSNQKKLLKISVSEISLITRLLYEQGLLDGSKKTFFEFISNNFKTSKRDIISPESLSNRYYSIPESAKISVRKMLRAILRQLNSIQSES